MTSEKHVFGAEVSKVLRLMIHSLYTNKDIFLRELISNASDACDKLRYEAITRPELLAGQAVLRITVTMDKANRTLTIADNGIGMSREELVNNLGTIARSGTQEFAAALSDKNASLIGQFGVGFYSAFIVADRVEVVSTRAGAQESWKWESNGEGEFTVGDAPSAARGTSITLHIKEGEDEYLDTFRLKHIIQTYSDHIAFPILLDGETVNRASALWTRPKSEITPEQYHEFYRHAAHQPEEPWLTLHTQAEGRMEYTALLFIPGIKPFDLFHPDRKPRVKLYVRRVFITEEGAEIVPSWLRFLRGVVDSQDLPLNISRETLQANPIVAKIREALVKRVLAELKKRMEANAEGYAKFWGNFGAVLKEGLCEAHAPREQILEVCRFATTAPSQPSSPGGEGKGGGMIGLDDYLARRKPGQEAVYYLTGANEAALRASAQLEGFKARGIEVLLLADHVDDFWLTVTPDYKGAPFVSVTRADIDLSRFPREGQEAPPAAPTQGDALAERFKAVLGDAVSDVRLTHKLTESPACLAVPEGGMDIRLERFLIEQKQLPGAQPKILEINPEHPILRALAEKLDDAAAEADMADTAWLLLDQARISEGEPVGDVAAFSRRMNAFMKRAL